MQLMVSSPLAAEIATAQSVRSAPGSAGWQPVAPNSYPRVTSTWSSPCLTDWHHWLCRTVWSSMVCCSGPVQKLYSKSLALPDISAPRSASSACCIPGIKKSNFILMSIASSPPVGSRSITLAGFHVALASFFPSLCCGAFFAASSSPLSSPPSQTAEQKLGNQATK